jgi:hypothetical protein
MVNASKCDWEVTNMNNRIIKIPASELTVGMVVHFWGYGWRTITGVEFEETGPWREMVTVRTGSDTYGLLTGRNSLTSVKVGA